MSLRKCFRRSRSDQYVRRKTRVSLSQIISRTSVCSVDATMSFYVVYSITVGRLLSLMLNCAFSLYAQNVIAHAKKHEPHVLSVCLTCEKSLLFLPGLSSLVWYFLVRKRSCSHSSVDNLEKLTSSSLYPLHPDNDLTCGRSLQPAERQQKLDVGSGALCHWLYISPHLSAVFNSNHPRTGQQQTLEAAAWTCHL